MNVDLSLSEEGVCHFNETTKWYCTSIRPEGSIFLVNLEAGWSVPFTREGKRCDWNGNILYPQQKFYLRNGTESVWGDYTPRSIVRFEPITYEEALLKYPTIQTETRP